MRQTCLSLLLLGAFMLQGQDSITLEKIWGDYIFTQKRVPGFNFMADGKSYSRLEKNEIRRYDLTTGKLSETLLSTNALKAQIGSEIEVDSYAFYDDENLIMIESGSEPIYRRSSKAHFHMYDRKAQKTTQIRKGDKVLYATPSPSGSKVAYVYENDIYIQDLKSGQTTQITTDGETNAIINGSADWVYEEEFAFAQAFHWSPDGQHIAYLRFDEREVPEFTMTNYRNELYPEYVTFKYPKVGEKNAIVSAHVYAVKTKKTVTVNIAAKDEYYIPRIRWTENADQLMVYKMNRHQNHLEILLADAASGTTKKILEEKNKYFVEITDDIRFLSDDRFIWSSEMEGYKQLYLYDLSGQLIRKLTKGDYDVIDFYGVDEANERIYFSAAEKSPLQQQVYSMNLKGTDKQEVIGDAGTSNAQFSSTYDYYVATTSTANVPATIGVYDRSGSLVRNIETNDKLKSIQKKHGVQPLEFFDFKTSEGVTLNGYMIKPADFDPSKQYPVFMYLYGGPGSQTVTDSWKGQNYWWFQMLAQNGYLVASVDNRGTGARGEEFRKQTYMNLGHMETMDQIEAAKYLGGLPYTDADRIGIFGWSYGGYMSSLCLLKGNDTFKAAIAVAPVTNWRWYDTIYTERYMRTEEENPDGYADNSPVNFADRLEGNYLLVHGMGDDNVHWQNSVEMANALIKANKQFDTYYYPNRNHGIYGGVTRLHLYQKMTDFLMDKL